jgi:hypothetical protein
MKANLNSTNMKKIMLIMLIAVAGLSACNKDQSTSGPVTAASLPLKATTYIDNNYPDASIDYVVMMSDNTARYIVTLNTTEELAFTEVGDYLGNGADYHGDHHGGDTICGDTTHPGGGHHGGGHHGGGHHGGPGHGIPVDSLSATITSYITANFTGYSIMHAEIDTLCPNGAVTEVMIGMQGSEPKKVVFDATNNYLLWAKRIRFTDVPEAVKDYITANYATYHVCDRGEQYTMADNSLQYTVFLMAGPVHKLVRLAADGTLVCEQ